MIEKQKEIGSFGQRHFYYYTFIFHINNLRYCHYYIFVSSLIKVMTFQSFYVAEIFVKINIMHLLYGIA